MSIQTISKVRPDFDLLFQDLYRRLSARGTWKDALPTSVGTTLLDMFAGVGVTDQFYIEASLREAFLGLARRDSSIYAGVRWLGISIARNSPAGVTVSALNNYDQSRYIAPYTAFDLGGKQFFTRSQIELVPGIPTEINLYQGTVKTVTFDLDGVIERRNLILNLGSSGFKATDLIAYTEDKVSGQTQLWSGTDESLWSFDSNSRIYYEDSTPAGDVALSFGDGVFGALLPAGHLLKVRYVETDGATSNNATAGIAGYCVVMPNIVVTSITPILGGSNKKEALYYKLFGNKMFRAGTRWISNADIQANLFQFPGMADAIVMGQRDIAPNDPSWMNVMRIVCLPEHSDTLGGANPNPQSASWELVRAFLKGRIHDMIQVQTWNAEKVYVTVRIVVAVTKETDINATKLQITERLLALFEKKPGILGRRLSLSDLKEACRVAGMDYVRILSPVEDIVPDAAWRYISLDGMPDVQVIFSERTSNENAYS